MHYPVTIKLRASRTLALLLTFAHGVSGLCTLSLPVDWRVRISILVFVLFSGLFQAYKLRRPPLQSLLLSKKCLALVPADGGEERLVDVMPDSVVFKSLIVLRIRFQDQDAGSASSFALLPDQMAPEHFRQLRIWLRWQLPGTNVSQAF